ncbi:MAG: LytTR family transcriptional regulator, partial [Clostridium lundense]|nr:LytTR family transcriptional regulator [Clostridium lundense]
KEQELSIRGNLKELCEKLGDTDFFRCHQSFLVNFAHVQDVEKKGFLLDNGDWVPISAANLSRSRAAFMEWSAAQD